MDTKQKTVQDYEAQIREIQTKKAAGASAVSIAVSEVGYKWNLTDINFVPILFLKQRKGHC